MPVERDQPADAGVGVPSNLEEPGELSPAAFREAISCFATGVTLITTTHESRPVGMTASAVCSLSLEPLLLLVCIDNRLSTHRAIDASRRFAVNVLGEDDADLAVRFARSGAGAEKFAGVPLVQDSDPPLLADAIANFVCDVDEVLAGGDHSIFVGRVRQCQAIPGRRPLLYFRSSFGSLDDPDEHFLVVSSAFDTAAVGGLGPSVQIPFPRNRRERPD